MKSHQSLQVKEQSRPIEIHRFLEYTIVYLFIKKKNNNKTTKHLSIFHIPSALVISIQLNSICVGGCSVGQADGCAVTGRTLHSMNCKGCHLTMIIHTLFFRKRYL